MREENSYTALKKIMGWTCLGFGLYLAGFQLYLYCMKGLPHIVLADSISGGCILFGAMVLLPAKTLVRVVGPLARLTILTMCIACVIDPFSDATRALACINVALIAVDVFLSEKAGREQAEETIDRLLTSTSQRS